jgi:tetratricopeptide (TPR) repeat protein/HEAT repeat protein
MRRTTWLVRLLAASLATLAVPAVTAPRSAWAQPGDDWDVVRDPFDKTVVARLKGLLARNPSDADALAKLLTLYRRYRSVELLRKEYADALAAKPTDFALLVVSGRLARSERDDATALALFERAVAVRPDPAVLVEVGALERVAGRLPEARAAFDAALAGNPGKAIKQKALRALADLALAGKDVDGARRYFEAYIALEPGNVALRLELGDALAGAGRHADAIAVYADAEARLSTDPARRVEVVARIGAAEEGMGDEVAAVATYRRAIKLVPRGYYLEQELTARIVDIYRRKGELAALIEVYDREWALARRGHFEWSTLGSLYEETGEQDKAVVALRKAVAKAPYELETQRRLIGLLESTGRELEAIKQYEEVARVAPGEARFQLELAERYFRLEGEAKALAAAKRLEARFPTDPGVLAALADLYQRWNKEDLALAVLERLARIEPDDPDHLVLLGEQYHQRGQTDRALATWKRIGTAKTPEAYARLGDVLAEHDQVSEGLVYYGKAIKAAPDKPALYRGRAEILERQRSHAEAVADWEKALSLLTQPSDRSARREARNRIVNLLGRWDGGSHRAPYLQRWERGFAATPPEVDAGYFLVAYYQRYPQQGQPRAVLERLQGLAPDDHEVLLDLVKALRGERTAAAFDRAVALLLAMAKADPSREREAYTLIAEIKTDARQDTEAITWAQKALEKSPNDPAGHQRLAERYVEMLQLDAAIAAYTKVIELAPRNWDAFFKLAELHQQRKYDDGVATELYRRILRHATDDAVLERAGKAAIALEEINQTLGDLERVLAPLSAIMSHKPIYRRHLLDLYLRYVPRLVARARHGTSEVRTAVRRELDRLGGSGMKPLLEALSDQDLPTERAAAVSVLGHLGNRAAALPLVRVAKLEPPALDPSAPRQLGTLRNALDLETRIAALVAAGRLADPRVVGEVLPLTRSDEVGLREAAVFALAGVDAPAATSALKAALADPRPSVAALACLAPHPSLAEAKRAVLLDQSRPDLVRAACAAGLVGGGPGAQAALVAAAGDNLGETQRLAAHALGVAGDRAAAPTLLRAYVARAGQERGTVIAALARLAGGPPAPPIRLDDYPMRAGKLDLAALVRALGAGPATVGDAAELLIGHEAAVGDALTAALAGHRDAALGALLDLDARATGLGLGELTAGALSPAAERALATIGERVRGSVLARVIDADPKVAARALAVAGKIGGAEAERALIAATTDDRRTLRDAAVAALGRMRAPSPAAVAAIAARLTADDWQDRRSAAAAMADLGAQADVAALTRAATDGKALVREVVARTLGAVAGSAGLEPLLGLSKDPAPSVRAAAAAALARSTDARAKARRAELATDPDLRVRAAASAPQP